MKYSRCHHSKSRYGGYAYPSASGGYSFPHRKHSLKSKSLFQQVSQIFKPRFSQKWSTKSNRFHLPYRQLRRLSRRSRTQRRTRNRQRYMKGGVGYGIAPISPSQNYLANPMPFQINNTCSK